MEALPIGDLIPIAESHPHLREIIDIKYMIEKYQVHEKTIVIGNEEYPHNPKRQFKIEEYDVALNYLRVFGNLTTRIDFVGTGFRAAENNEISKHIAKYCSKTLVDLQASNAGRYLSEDAEETFTYVNRVLFEFDDSVAVSRVHEIYPVVGSITIQLHPPSVSSNDENIQQIRNLLPKVPQLNTLVLIGITANNLLESISEHLPKLKALNINYDTNVTISKPVHFKNVTSFSLSILPRGRDILNERSPFSFDRLEQLEIFTMEYRTIPIQLIESSNYLKLFHLPWLRDDYGVDHIVEFLGRKKHLQQVTLHWWPSRAPENTISMIYSLENVRIIKFIVWDSVYSTVNRDAVIRLIPEEWAVYRVEKGYEFGFQANHISFGQKKKIAN